MKKAFDLIVIGGGSGGVSLSRRAAGYGATVGVVEKARLVMVPSSLTTFHPMVLLPPYPLPYIYWVRCIPPASPSFFIFREGRSWLGAFDPLT
jgi:hypothetical protein